VAFSLGSWAGTGIAPGFTTEQLGAWLAGDVPADLDRIRRRRCEAANGGTLGLGHLGEIEIALEVARLRSDLRGDEDEVVCVEQRAHVLVGEKPRVRGVARALESVHLEAAQRVHRAELIGDEDAPSRTRHAGQLGHDELRTPDVVEHAEAGREIEGRV
jgi:hypothetical protein